MKLYLPTLFLLEAQMNRDFKGIWIPREIWLSNLSCQEKCLWAEIHSLFDREQGGCYASNDYLGDFVGVKERRLQEMMSNLKFHGWLVQVSFDGRRRIIKAVVPPENFKPDDGGAGQRCGKVHPRDAEKCTPEVSESAPLPYIREQSLEQSLEHIPSPLPEKAANAADVRASESSIPKQKREKAEFSPKVRETANQMLNLLLQYNPVYRPPSDLTKFLVDVHEIVEKDKQDPEVVLKTFEWAVSDNEKRGDFNGWQGIIATNNKGGKSTTPAAIFRKHFSKIHSQMGSKPKRKFAASSNEDEALEAMREMSARAI
jgi:hypothetical protein